VATELERCWHSRTQIEYQAWDVEEETLAEKCVDCVEPTSRPRKSSLRGLVVIAEEVVVVAPAIIVIIISVIGVLDIAEIEVYGDCNTLADESESSAFVGG